MRQVHNLNCQNYRLHNGGIPFPLNRVLVLTKVLACKRDSDSF